jgi:hypothetical protein
VVSLKLPLAEVKVKVKKGKVHPTAGHEGPEGGRGIAVYSLTSALVWGWVFNATPWPLYPLELPVTHFVGGPVGLRAGLDGCGKSRRHWDTIPGSSSL